MTGDGYVDGYVGEKFRDENYGDSVIEIVGNPDWYENGDDSHPAHEVYPVRITGTDWDGQEYTQYSVFSAEELSKLKHYVEFEKGFYQNVKDDRVIQWWDSEPVDLDDWTPVVVSGRS